MLTECVVEQHVTANYVKISRVDQQCFYDQFTSPAKIKCSPRASSCSVPDAALQLKNLADGLSTYNWPKQIVMTSRSFSGFVRVAVKHLRNSDAINQLRSTRY